MVLDSVCLHMQYDNVHPPPTQLLLSSASFPPGVLGCSLVLMAQGFYSANDDVVELNPSNFNREVLQSDSLWLIEFYAPW